MRTNIEIDDKLMKQAMKASGAKTKKAAVEAALKLFVDRSKQRDAIESMWGIGGWEGDLEWSRTKDKWTETAGHPSTQRSSRKRAA
jgi:Arc/MetJ family transcription regulator